MPAHQLGSAAGRGGECGVFGGQIQSEPALKMFRGLAPDAVTQTCAFREGGLDQRKLQRLHASTLAPLQMGVGLIEDLHHQSGAAHQCAYLGQTGKAVGEFRVIRRIGRASQDQFDPKRIKPIVEVARARFEDTQALRRELDEISQKLSDRKLVDKAKGVLMKARGLDEDAAYHAMRKLAMERGQSMAKVARDVIDMARVLL